MIACFADTSYFIALVNGDDDAHADAHQFTVGFSGRIITTEWVLNELANFLSRPPNRELFLSMLQDLRTDGRVTIVSTTDCAFTEGVDLYGQRLDKEWSVTDCISFQVMREFGISEAFTKDHHFEQAGFGQLLK